MDGVGKTKVVQLLDRLTMKEAAAVLGYSISMLQHWRKGSKVWRPGLGPYFFSINGCIFYPKESIDDRELLFEAKFSGSTPCLMPEFEFLKNKYGNKR